MADILVIEDNPENMLMMKRWLGAMNCQTFEASTGFAGIVAAQKHIPSIILLDINLPDIDGYQVFEKLKKSSITRDIPVIAITSNAMQGDEEMAIKAGFDGYMAKPVNFSALISKMSMLGVPVSYTGVQGASTFSAAPQASIVSGK